MSKAEKKSAPPASSAKTGAGGTSFWQNKAEKELLADRTRCYLCTEKKEGLKVYVMAAREGKAQKRRICPECNKAHGISERLMEVPDDPILPPIEKLDLRKHASYADVVRCDWCSEYVDHDEVVNIKENGEQLKVCLDCFGEQKVSDPLYPNRCTVCNRSIKESQTRWVDDQSPLCSDCYYKQPNTGTCRVRCESCESKVPINEAIIYGGFYFCDECANIQGTDESVKACSNCGDVYDKQALHESANGRWLCSTCAWLGQQASDDTVGFCDLCYQQKTVNLLYEYIDSDDVLWATCAPCFEKLSKNRSLEHELGMRYSDDDLVTERLSDILALSA